MGLRTRNKSNTTGNMSETEDEIDGADTDSDQEYMSCNEEYDGADSDDSAECEEILDPRWEKEASGT